MITLNKKIIFFLLICLQGCMSSQSQEQQMPNVILIVADDMGYGDLGCYGQQKIETPHLDALAADGMRFTSFYAGAPVCAPSRAALMTGLHTGHTAIRGNFEIQPEGQLPLPDSAFTIAELFQQAGYSTGGFGKWGLGYPTSEGIPLKQGFDEFYGYNCQREAHNHFPDHLWHNGKKIMLKNDLQHQQQYAAELIQQSALDFISGQQQPFFVYMAYTLPHAALQVPEGDSLLPYYIRKFNEQPVPVKPWNGKGYQPQPYPHAAYAVMVTRLDQYVGEIINQLKKNGQWENTLIIFTSDNGPHIEGGNDPDFFNSNGPWRGRKRDLFEGGIRVPLIVNWPGKTKKGTVSKFPFAAWDLLPTFADITDQNLNNPADGISVYPLWTKGKNETTHDYFYWEFHEGGGKQAVRMGKYKCIRMPLKAPSKTRILLFDLEQDPAEKNDISKAFPDIVERMTGIMDEAHVANKDFLFVGEGA